MKRIAVLLAALVALTPVFATGAAPSKAADNLPRCMTMPQARAKFPTKHIFWHGRNHCWDDVPGLGRKNSFRLPPNPRDANGNIIHHSGLPIDIDEIQYREEAEHRLAEGVWPPPEQFEPAPIVIDPNIMDQDFLPWELRVAGVFER